MPHAKSHPAPPTAPAASPMAATVTKILQAHDLLAQFTAATDFHVRFLNEPWMPLVIEQHAGQVAVAHTFIQEMDIMCDPEIVFALPTWEAVEITQHPLGIYRAKYHGPGRHVDLRFDAAVLPLVRLWARNLLAQGYADPAHCRVVTVEIN